MSRPQVRRVRLFLDANVLVSAAWKSGSKVVSLWTLQNVDLVTSDYVVAECRRNLPNDDQQNRLDGLLLTVRVLKFLRIPVLENPPSLPEKDQPVLAAAVLARADFLVTGDRRHFGEWFGSAICGVRVEPPARFPQALDER